MLAKVAIIESTENWRTALSGAAEVYTLLAKVAVRVHRVHRELENSPAFQVHTLLAKGVHRVHRELENSPFMCS